MEDRYSLASEYGLSNDRVVDVSSGICPLGPSRKVRAAIRRSIRHIRNVPDQQCRNLRRYFLSRCGLPGDSLCFANSLRELMHSFIALTQPKKVLISGPALPLYEEIAHAAGAEILYVHTTADDGFAVDAQEIINQMDGVDLVVMANPNRITGKTLVEDAILKIISEAEGRSIRVVLDESLADFTERDSFCPDRRRGENLIILRTTAFFYGMPGLELACGITHPLIAGAVQRMQTSPPGVLSADAALAAFRDAVYRKEARDFISRERAWLMKALRKLEGVVCHESDANVFLLKIEGPSEDLLHFLGRAGFYARHCGDIKGVGSNFLRCSVMRHDKTVRFLRLLKGRLKNISVAD